VLNTNIIYQEDFMRYGNNKKWPNEVELNRQNEKQSMKLHRNGLSYNNKPVSIHGGLNSCVRGGFCKEPSYNNQSVGEPLLNYYNAKSPYNNAPISSFTRLVAALTTFVLVASGSSALLGREPMTEEEKAALARAQKAVVYTITEDGTLVTESYIKPAETQIVKQKEAN
jgi:hypothetical protein